MSYICIKSKQDKMTKQEIHTAIQDGSTVNWKNSLYEVERVKVGDTNKFADPSRVDGYGLRIYCTTNYFGSLASERCLTECFLKQ